MGEGGGGGGGGATRVLCFPKTSCSFINFQNAFFLSPIIFKVFEKFVTEIHQREIFRCIKIHFMNTCFIQLGNLKS